MGALTSPDFEILLSCPLGLDATQVQVDFARHHDRQAHPEPANEELVAKTWDARREKQPNLYNGSKFRYAGFDILAEEPVLEDGEGAADGQKKGQPKKISLKLGLTDYRSFVGTNLRDDWTELVAGGESDADRCRHLADPLGNAALVRTADDKALMLQRGHDVGEFPDVPVFPGGHPEPVEVGISSHQRVLYTDEERTQLNSLIALEMFAGIIREVEEETGAPADSLSNVRFLGMVRRTKNARPVGMFVCDCSLTSAEVMAKYQTAEHKFESLRLRAVPLDALKDESVGMPGCHKGGCALALEFLELEKKLKR